MPAWPGHAGVATPICRGPWVLTAHMFVPVHFASVHLQELVLSKFVAPSPSHPFGKYGFVVYVVHIFCLTENVFSALTFCYIPLISQCDAARWLPLIGLSWFRTLLGSLYLWRYRSFRHQPQSSSTDNEFNPSHTAVCLTLGACSGYQTH